MEASTKKTDPVEYDEEYVLLDLDSVCSHTYIPANAPYDLSVSVYLQRSVVDNYIKL